MKKSEYLHWAPRILALLLIGFVSIFALDVIGEPGWIVSLAIHLIPSYILITLTAVAWRYRRVGGVLFLLFAGGLALFTHFEAGVVYIPIILVGMLFLVF